MSLFIVVGLVYLIVFVTGLAIYAWLRESTDRNLREMASILTPVPTLASTTVATIHHDASGTWIVLERDITDLDAGTLYQMGKMAQDWTAELWRRKVER